MVEASEVSGPQCRVVDHMLPERNEGEKIEMLCRSLVVSLVPRNH